MKLRLTQLIFYCLISILSVAQSVAPFNGSIRSSSFVNGYKTVSQTGTTTNSSINLSNRKGVQHFALDFDKTPYKRDTTLNYYEIGHIPDQTVVSGGLLDFYVKCDSLHAVNKTFLITQSLVPGGILYFKSYLQYFHFEPNVTDTVNFYVFFIAVNGTDTIKQKVLFKTYKPAYIDNYSFGVGNGQQIPDPNNKEYQIVTITNNQPELFNGVIRKTRNVSITGIDLYAENVNGNFLISLASNEDIKELNIYAERLFIRDSIRLPQTKVNIYCKELYFQDYVGHGIASINTTPIKPVASLPGSPGVNGAPAGDISVFASKIIDDAGNIRFILIGGDGQDATNAQAGSGGNAGKLISNQDIFYKGDYLGGLAGIPAGTGTLAVNQKGIFGQFIKDTISNRWIHPNYVRQILAYSDDAYYLGYGNEVLLKLLLYDELIKDFIYSKEFSALDVYKQNDLMQVDMELITLNNRIFTGLDYFGNPIGWIPLLSFEFTQAAFESELKHAMQILYLNYFITSAADTLQKRVDGYTALRDELYTQSIVDKNGFNNLILTAIPDIENKIDQNNQRLQELSAKKDAVMRDIEARAQHQLDAASKGKPAWEKIAGAIGTVCTMIPVPAVQAVGAVTLAGLAVYDNLKQVDNFNINNIDQIVQAGQVGFDTYNKIKGGFTATQSLWSNIGTQWQNFFPIFQGGVSINSIKTQVAKGQGLYDSLNLLVSNIDSKYKAFLNVPDPNLQKIRSNLMATDPVLASLNASLTETAEKHKLLLDQYKSTNDQIQGLASQIVGNSIAYDDANTKVLNNVKVLDHRTVHYIQYLKQDAIRRLKKYNYYMAKAFEFRTLLPYTGNLNINTILNSAESMAIASGNGILTNAQYQTLADLYRNQISQVAENIYDYYQANAPSQTIKSTYIVPKADLNELNKGNKVFFNPINRGLFADDEENIRIVNLRVRTLYDSVGNGTIGSPARIDVKFEYPNESYIKNKGKVYYFNNYNLNTITPLSWSSRYDKNTQSIIDFRPSAATSSLLQSLLISQSLPSTNNDLLMYSRPSAGARLIMSSNYQNNGGTSALYIDSMVIEVEYDFNLKPVNISYLDIQTEPPWIVPEYTMSRLDNNSMQNGQGNMIRSYSTSNSVSLTTQSKIGGYRFERWLDKFGNPLRDADSINPKRTFTMGQSRFNKVKYKWAGPILVLPDTLYFNSNQTTKSLFVDNQGESNMYWVVDTMSSWVNISGNIRQGNNDANLNVSIQGSTGNRLGYIVFVAPEAESAIDTVWINYKMLLDVPNQSLKSATVYPNPAANQLFLETNGIPITEINIYDISGILVLKEKPPKDKWIDISGLQNGIYIAEIKTNNSTVMKKWIKM